MLTKIFKNKLAGLLDRNGNLQPVSTPGSALPLFLAHFFTSVRLSSFLPSLPPSPSTVSCSGRRQESDDAKNEEATGLSTACPSHPGIFDVLYHDPSINLEFVLHLATEMIKSTSNAKKFDAVTASTSEAIFRSPHHCNTESAR